MMGLAGRDADLDRGRDYGHAPAGSSGWRGWCRRRSSRARFRGRCLCFAAGADTDQGALV
jgi:hypothetical protein